MRDCWRGCPFQFYKRECSGAEVAFSWDNPILLSSVNPQNFAHVWMLLAGTSIPAPCLADCCTQRVPIGKLGVCSSLLRNLLAPEGQATPLPIERQECFMTNF